MAAPSPAALRAMIAPNAVFHSPVVHTPQEGTEKVFAYLWAAAEVLGNESFSYARELIDGDQACLEFTCVLNGVQVNGIDLIRWNADGQITDFKVMVRPLKAMNAVWEAMAAQLAGTPAS
jgi:SnoaL-like domain